MVGQEFDFAPVLAAMGLAESAHEEVKILVIPTVMPIMRLLVLIRIAAPGSGSGSGSGCSLGESTSSSGDNFS